LYTQQVVKTLLLAELTDKVTLSFITGCEPK
jgi:hypothetical protein